MGFRELMARGISIVLTPIYMPPPLWLCANYQQPFYLLLQLNTVANASRPKKPSGKLM